MGDGSSDTTSATVGDTPLRSKPSKGRQRYAFQPVATGGELERGDILELRARLIDQSLVVG